MSVVDQHINLIYTYMQTHYIYSYIYIYMYMYIYIHIYIFICICKKKSIYIYIYVAQDVQNCQKNMLRGCTFDLLQKARRKARRMDPSILFPKLWMVSVLLPLICSSDQRQQTVVVFVVFVPFSCPPALPSTKKHENRTKRPWKRTKTTKITNYIFFYKKIQAPKFSHIVKP